MESSFSVSCLSSLTTNQDARKDGRQQLKLAHWILLPLSTERAVAGAIQTNSKSTFVTWNGMRTFPQKSDSNDSHRSGPTVFQSTVLETPVIDPRGIIHAVTPNDALTLSSVSQQGYQQPPQGRTSRDLHSPESPTSSVPPSTYPTSTLPEYHARSVSPPSYSHFARSRSQSIQTPSTRTGNERFWSLGSDLRPPSLTTQVDHNEKQ